MYWFRAKRYGWGWGWPSSWQGWIVLAAFVALLGAGAIVLPPGGNLGAFLAYVLLLAGCVYLPRTTVVYDQDCRIEAKHMTLEMAQIGQLGHCGGNQCA